MQNLWEGNADNIPEVSRFLLEIDYEKIMQPGVHSKHYWVVAIEAAIVVDKNSIQQTTTQVNQDKPEVIDPEKILNFITRPRPLWEEEG